MSQTITHALNARSLGARPAGPSADRGVRTFCESPEKRDKFLTIPFPPTAETTRRIDTGDARYRNDGFADAGCPNGANDAPG
ncbi:MAG TPA: hypothetical protein VF800_04570 [Telluria sp.]|jgi:hypothetical protein